MDYSGRMNDDIDDGTTEGSLWRNRDPEMFYDSYSTRKWMSDITGKELNIKPLLAKVSKEVNICVGRILHKDTLVRHGGWSLETSASLLIYT